MDYPVRKGLDTALKVQGMYTNYFAIYCIILAVLVITAVGVLMNVVSGTGSFFSFIVTLAVCGGMAVFARIYFVRRSDEKKFTKFSKKIYVISNKDLLHTL